MTKTALKKFINYLVKSINYHLNLFYSLCYLKYCMNDTYFLL